MAGLRSHIFGNVFADSLNGPGTGITGINPGTAFTPLAINSVLITGGTGLVTTAAQLSPAMGGTGTNFSGSTGGLPFVIVNTDGVFTNGGALAAYGSTGGTVPIRDIVTGALHDSAAFVCDGLGTPAVADREYAQLRWDVGTSRYYVETVATGLGTSRPIYFSASYVYSLCRVGGDLAANAPEDYVRKAEFDSAIAGVSYQRAVLAITSTPPAPAEGDRYIAAGTTPVPPWTKDHIYQWVAATSTWTDYTPAPGWACYVLGGLTYPDQTVIYTDVPSVWSPFGASIDHFDVLNRGTNTHAQIDSHIAATTTDPHAGQDLRSTASPTHANLTLQTATPALTFTSSTAGPPTPGSTAITLAGDGVLRYTRPVPGTVGETGFDMQTGFLASGAYMSAPLFAIPAAAAGIRVAPIGDANVATHPFEVYGTTSDATLRLVRVGAPTYDASFDVLAATGELRINATLGAQFTTRIGVGIASEADVGIASLCASGEQIRLYYDAVTYSKLQTQADGSLDITTTGTTIRTDAANLVLVQSLIDSLDGGSNPSISFGSLRTLGGLGVAKRVTATNMTCLTAPVLATDVVRFGDLGTFTTDYYTGFPRTTSSEATLSFDDGTLTFTIAPTGANFTFWSNGTLFTKTVAQTKAIANTNGIHYLYFDGSGVLQETTSFTDPLILNYAIVADVYWNDNLAQSIVLSDERHGFIMSPETHLNLHVGEGAIYKSGITPGGFTTGGAGATDAEAQFTTTQGSIMDEDRVITVNAKTLVTSQVYMLYLVTTGGTNRWQRVLTSAGVYTTGGAAQYNLLSGGTTWSITPVTNGRYILGHVFASNQTPNLPFLIMGQTQYTGIVNARQGALAEIEAMYLVGMPSPEMVAIATIILECNTGFGNAFKARVVQYSTGINFVDWRTQKLNSTTTITDHGNLSGLADDDHLQYVTVAGRIGDVVTIPNVTASSSTTTGALIVTGGIGCAANVYGAGMRSVMSGATQYLYTGLVPDLAGAQSAFAMVFGKAISVGNCASLFWRHVADASASNYCELSIWGTSTLQVFSDHTNIFSTTASTSTITGALTVAGGIGAAGQIYAAGMRSVTVGNASIGFQSFVPAISAGQYHLGLQIGKQDGVAYDSGQFLWFHTANGSADNYMYLALWGGSLFKFYYNRALFEPATASTSQTTGALVVTGGLGVGGSIFSGNITVLTTNGTISLENNGAGVARRTCYMQWDQANSRCNIGTWNGATSGADYPVYIVPPIASTSTTTGALVVAGGVGVAGNLWIGGYLMDGDYTNEYTGHWAPFNTGESTDCTLTAVRVGRMCHIHIASQPIAKALAAEGPHAYLQFLINSITDLPTAYRPTNAAVGTMWVIHSGVNATVCLVVTGGSIRLYRMTSTWNSGDLVATNDIDIVYATAVAI